MRGLLSQESVVLRWLGSKLRSISISKELIKVKLPPKDYKSYVWHTTVASPSSESVPSSISLTHHERLCHGLWRKRWSETSRLLNTGLRRSHYPTGLKPSLRQRRSWCGHSLPVWSTGFALWCGSCPLMLGFSCCTLQITIEWQHICHKTKIKSI